MSLSQLDYGLPGPVPLPSCSGPPGYPRCGTRFYDDRGAAERGYRVMLQGANSSGDAGLGGDRYTQRAGYRQCRMPGYPAIPAPCYPAARAEGVEAEIELPFAAPYQAGGNSGSAGVPARSLVRCAESGVRRDGRAAADHLFGMAACPGLVVGWPPTRRPCARRRPTSRSRCCAAP